MSYEVKHAKICMQEEHSWHRNHKDGTKLERRSLCLECRVKGAVVDQIIS